ncbi:MAG: phosphate starvation-inducible protein PhoH [Alphaproteobacteria bacterium]|nr:phosphate starvation-inducible protein PhoH [Alphaproteobacteria bacterium]
MHFDDNSLLPALFGRHDEHLVEIERMLDVKLRYRGNRLEIAGAEASRALADRAITSLYRQLKEGREVVPADVQAAVRMAAVSDEPPAPGQAISTRRRRITARSPGQAGYLAALDQHELVFALGPAGSGKTYLAVAKAVALLLEGRVDRIILSRPAVEAGERLGFLPGDLQEKINPYLRPLYDALYDMLPADQVARRLASGEIEVAPLAFMRGRTLANAFVILDEAQNTTPVQMKMFLTRLGESSRMAVTGDLSQIDLPRGARSGLQDAVEILGKVEGVAFIRLTDADMVRHPLVTRVVKAYDAFEDPARGRPDAGS